MSKFDDAVAKYVAEAKKLNLDVSTGLISTVAKGLGPVIYNADSELVSTSDKAEMDRVRDSFLVKKLGLAAGPELDKAIKEVTDKMGSSNRSKYRVLFYALLVKKFKKESVYA
ncbi:MAG: DUF2853 family protein [Nevskiaceae bacterium]|nr:MAG: DUF2853 family protein [Nevskiaceae bacterium]TBR72734.1 MAG: DUF2853 family protein [Nevskiaceae bacterium]